MTLIKLKVLDNRYLVLIDSMGVDKAVIQAARRCYLSEPQGEDARYCKGIRGEIETKRIRYGFR